jgi:hypothetical protein
LLDGSNNYKLHLSAGIPAAVFDQTWKPDDVVKVKRARQSTAEGKER